LALTCYITDRNQLSPPDSKEKMLIEKVRAAFSAGVDYVQLREKDLDGGPLAALVDQLVRSPEKVAFPGRPSSSSRLLVNERMDVARACEADGVHLPADSLPVAAVRGAVGGGWTISAACHSLEEVRAASEAGADLVMVAPVFDTASKPGMQPMGLERFAEICARSPIPVFALGGVTPENARSCIAAGAKGVAGIRVFQQAADLGALCAQLRRL
jgi:thiamine-phosphate pyrophosphorylase